MHQIDILLSAKQNEGKSQVHGLKNQLQMREREMSSLRVAIQEKNTQVSLGEGVGLGVCTRTYPHKYIHYFFLMFWLFTCIVHVFVLTGLSLFGFR